MNTEIESTVSSATVNLAFALRLSPLDRVQLATVWEFGQMRHHRQMYGDGELPFFFFQRVIDNERIEVRNPAGRDAVVSALDVCDVRRTTPDYSGDVATRVSRTAEESAGNPRRAYPGIVCTSICPLRVQSQKRRSAGSRLVRRRGFERHWYPVGGSAS